MPFGPPGTLGALRVPWDPEAFLKSYNTQLGADWWAAPVSTAYHDRPYSERGPRSYFDLTQRTVYYCHDFDYEAKPYRRHFCTGNGVHRPVGTVMTTVQLEQVAHVEHRPSSDDDDNDANDANDGGGGQSPPNNSSCSLWSTGLPSSLSARAKTCERARKLGGPLDLSRVSLPMDEVPVNITVRGGRRRGGPTDEGGSRTSVLPLLHWTFHDAAAIPRPGSTGQGGQGVGQGYFYIQCRGGGWLSLMRENTKQREGRSGRQTTAAGKKPTFTVAISQIRRHRWRVWTWAPPLKEGSHQVEDRRSFLAISVGSHYLVPGPSTTGFHAARNESNGSIALMTVMDDNAHHSCMAGISVRDGEHPRFVGRYHRQRVAWGVQSVSANTPALSDNGDTDKNYSGTQQQHIGASDNGRTVANGNSTSFTTQLASRRSTAVLLDAVLPRACGSDLDDMVYSYNVEMVPKLAERTCRCVEACASPGKNDEPFCRVASRSCAGRFGSRPVPYDVMGGYGTLPKWAIQCRHLEESERKKNSQRGRLMTEWKLRAGSDSLLTTKERTQMEALLAGFARAMQALNVTWWLNHGTLLGLLRHDGFIPWDNDLDVAVSNPDWERAVGNRTSFQRVFAREGLGRWAKWLEYEGYDQVYLVNGTSRGADKCPYPFIDIWPYRHTGDNTRTRDNTRAVEEAGRPDGWQLIDFAKAAARELWSSSWFVRDELFPLQQVPWTLSSQNYARSPSALGNKRRGEMDANEKTTVTVFIPRCPQCWLDRRYGDSWPLVGPQHAALLDAFDTEVGRGHSQFTTASESFRARSDTRARLNACPSTLVCRDQKRRGG